MKRLFFIGVSLLLSLSSFGNESAWTKDNDAWLGIYEYGMCLENTGVGSTPCITYRLKITKLRDGLIAYLDSDGFQTMERIRGKVITHDDQVDIILTDYRKGNLYTPYKPGDKLFSLTKSDGKIFTYWNKMMPGFDFKLTEKTNVYFTKKTFFDQRASETRPDSFFGAYGFDWFSPSPTKCRLISKDSPKDFTESYICKKHVPAKGAPPPFVWAECIAKEKASSYLMFKTEKDCKERKQYEEIAE